MPFRGLSVQKRDGKESKRHGHFWADAEFIIWIMGVLKGPRERFTLFVGSILVCCCWNAPLFSPEDKYANS